MLDPIFSSATALATAIREKQVSSLEVVDAHLARIEEVDPQINAVVLVTAESARIEAREADAVLAKGEVRGPLHGVPFTVKDSIETAGVVSTGGTAGRAAYVPSNDATAVARLRSAGGILLGKTNLPELCLAGESDNILFGRTNNPYGVSRTVGGSSGGEAAIVASGGSPLGLGSDEGGSVRLPAYWCGVAALKPTHGRLPRTGHWPPSAAAVNALMELGPIARHSEDLVLALAVMSGPDWIDPEVVQTTPNTSASLDLKKLRIAFHVENGVAEPTPETADAIHAAANALSDLGCVLEEDRPEVLQESQELEFRLMGVDGGSGVRQALEEAGTDEVSPLTQQVLNRKRAAYLSGEELNRLLEHWTEFRARMLSFMRAYDAILSPAVAIPAPPHGGVSETLPGISYLPPYNQTGWPAVVVRAGTSPEGLPLGVQVATRPWRDEVALALAGHIEAALGGWRRPLI